MKAALEGARDIVAEGIGENADLLGRLRAHMREVAMLRSRVVDGKKEAGAKFSDYFDHTERWATTAGHRALAMLRGWNEEVLSVDITVDEGDTSPVKPVERIIAASLAIGTGPADKWLMEVIGWTWRVKLSMSLSLDLMRELRERAEEEAIRVFARNLKDLLLAAPAGSRPTMGSIPASAPASRSPWSMAPASCLRRRPSIHSRRRTTFAAPRPNLPASSASMGWN